MCYAHLITRSHKVSPNTLLYLVKLFRSRTSTDNSTAIVALLLLILLITSCVAQKQYALSGVLPSSLIVLGLHTNLPVCHSA